MAKAKQIVVEMEGHHRSDFRGYTFRFADKGSKKANLKHALFKAIMKEDQWNDWVGLMDCPFDGKAFEAEVKLAVDKMIDSGKGIGTIFAWSDKGRNDKEGLVFWARELNTKDPNIGFGYGSRDSYSGVDTNPLGIEHTDKGDNKWITFK